MLQPSNYIFNVWYFKLKVAYACISKCKKSFHRNKVKQDNVSITVDESDEKSIYQVASMIADAMNFDNELQVIP